MESISGHVHKSAINTDNHVPRHRVAFVKIQRHLRREVCYRYAMLFLQIWPQLFLPT